MNALSSFSVGELAWSTRGHCVVRVAGAVELFEVPEVGKVAAHRVVRSDGGKPEPGSIHVARPMDLRKLQRQFVSDWSRVSACTGWDPLRSVQR